MTGVRLTTAVTLSLFTTVAVGGNWPGFRGAAGSGVAYDKNLPQVWSMEKNIAWTAELPGRGDSSPAVNSRHVYVTSQAEGQIVVGVCRRPKRRRHRLEAQRW